MSWLTSWEHKVGKILKLTSGNELVTICVIFTNILHMEMSLKFISACQQMHKPKIVQKMVRQFRNFENFILMKNGRVQTAKANSDSKSEPNSSLFEISIFLSLWLMDPGNSRRESFRKIILIFIGKFPALELDRFKKNSSNREFKNFGT